MSIDTSMYELFKKLKKIHTPVMIHVSDAEIARVPKNIKDPTSFRDYVRRRFRDEHQLEIIRYSHDYKANKLGLVHLSTDSVIYPGFEVWALVGYNAVEIERLDK